MIEFIKNHIDTLITVSVTIVGFVVTFLMSQKKFRDEIIQSKVMSNADNIRSLPYDICQLMNKFSNKSGAKPLPANEYVELLSKVLAYGSRAAISIAVHLQEMVYANNAQADTHSLYEMLACYSLLITQIKYDLTAETISPECWFKLKLTDYSKSRSEIVKASNYLVKELDLRKDFLIEDLENGLKE